MSYTALYRKFRPDNFDDVRTGPYCDNTDQPDQGEPYRTRIPVLRNAWYRKNYGCKDPGEGSKL